jgi:hypothetical protein
MECKIVYVGTGWKWRAASSAGGTLSSERSYGLFYDCVLAARAKGYTPAGVLPACYRKASSSAG